mmetsp:Transcript_6790/g.9726  ORF Transcript_6790/g.9726 Transcript_6790/m.9726 type:complete len:252 (-) Transcript_6790:57-812(-)
MPGFIISYFYASHKLWALLFLLKNFLNPPPPFLCFSFFLFPSFGRTNASCIVIVVVPVVIIVLFLLMFLIWSVSSECPVFVLASKLPPSPLRCIPLKGSVSGIFVGTPLKCDASLFVATADRLGFCTPLSLESSRSLRFLDARSSSTILLISALCSSSRARCSTLSSKRIGGIVAFGDDRFDPRGVTADSGSTALTGEDPPSIFICFATAAVAPTAPPEGRTLLLLMLLFPSPVRRASCRYSSDRSATGSS